MVLDYSEKRGGRENRETVAERKPVQKNRPRKESGGMFALLSVAALLFTFGAGLLTGWFVFGGKQKALPAAAVAQAAKTPQTAPLAVPAKPAGPDAPLTFYKTLPAGGKGTIGTGLNLTKMEPALTMPRHAPAAAAAPAGATPPAGATAGNPAGAAGASEKQEASARFVVQVASYREKQEADEAQAKLAGKGIAAYVVESKVADKGVWYRIRVGRHLSKEEAGTLAGKSGKGAIVLPE